MNEENPAVKSLVKGAAGYISFKSDWARPVSREPGECGRITGLDPQQKLIRGEMDAVSWAITAQLHLNVRFRTRHLYVTVMPSDCPAGFSLNLKVKGIKGQFSAARLSGAPPFLCDFVIEGPFAKLADQDNWECRDQLIHLQLSSSGDFLPCEWHLSLGVSF